MNYRRQATRFPLLTRSGIQIHQSTGSGECDGRRLQPHLHHRYASLATAKAMTASESDTTLQASMTLILFFLCSLHHQWRHCLCAVLERSLLTIVHWPSLSKREPLSICYVYRLHAADSHHYGINTETFIILISPSFEPSSVHQHQQQQQLRKRPPFIMKLFTMLALASAAYAVPTDHEICAARKGGADKVKAIQGLCARRDIVVPSDYAMTGFTSGKQKAWIYGMSLSFNSTQPISCECPCQRVVSTGPNCKPAQWLPKYWCHRQMFALCAASPDGFGATIEKFGKDDCQIFNLT